MATKLYEGFFDFLADEFGLATQTDMAKFLGVKQPEISQFRRNRRISKTLWRRFLTRIRWHGWHEGVADSNLVLINALKDACECQTDGDLRKIMGVVQPQFSQWKNGYYTIPKTRIGRVLKRLRKLDARIQPLVEMYPIRPTKPRGKWYFFAEEEKAKGERLRKKLKGKQGLYCYYDSRGILSYVGLAIDTPLEIESEARLKAEIDGVRFRDGLVKLHKKSGICQGEVARFISAYWIEPRALIPRLEKMTMRMSANTNLNKKLEKF